MCGLFGVAGDIGYKDKDVFDQLMIISALRGMDSAGVASIANKTQEAVVMKTVGNPYDLIMHPKYDSVRKGYGVKALIGHVRKATQGGISKMTAHPFHSEHIVMTHNGTLTNWRQAWKEAGVVGDYLSDSQKITDAVATMGIKDAIAETEGAYCLIWFDQKTDSLNFLRNNQRTLWYAMSENGKTLYWASEWRMLQLVLDRNDIKLWHNEEKGNARFHPLPEDMHVEWDLGNGAASDFVVIRTHDDLKGGTAVKTYVPLAGNYGNNYRDNRNYAAEFRAEWEEDPVTKLWRKKGSQPTVIGKAPTVVHPFAKNGKEGTLTPGELLAEQQALLETGEAFDLWEEDDADLAITVAQQKAAIVAQAEAPLLVPAGTTPTAEGSTITPTTTTSSTKRGSKRTSTPKPTLSLVASNKSGDSAKSKPATGKQPRVLVNPLSEEVEQVETVESFHGEQLDEKAYLEATHGKCGFCDADISFKEAQNGHIAEWVDRSSFVCVHCTGVRAVVSC